MDLLIRGIYIQYLIYHKHNAIAQNVVAFLCVFVKQFEFNATTAVLVYHKEMNTGERNSSQIQKGDPFDIIFDSTLVKKLF